MLHPEGLPQIICSSRLHIPFAQTHFKIFSNWWVINMLTQFTKRDKRSPFAFLNSLISEPVPAVCDQARPDSLKFSKSSAEMKGRSVSLSETKRR